MTDLLRLKVSEPGEEIAGALAEHGAVVVEDLLGADLLERFNAELDPLLTATSADHERKFVNDAVGGFFGAETRHLTGVAGKSAVFASEILPHPVFLAVCDEVLAPSCARYQLNTAQVLDRGPGSQQQFLHRDQDVWAHLPKPHPEIQLASMIALVDFTTGNGATRVAPGSHRWPADRAPTDADLVAGEMSAGSAIIYLGSTIHAGGANVTDSERRRGMHVSYCLGWLRTEENQYLAAPIDTVRVMPRQAQELLGYSVHDAIACGGGYLGAVELQDPVELLADGSL